MLQWLSRLWNASLCSLFNATITESVCSVTVTAVICRFIYSTGKCRLLWTLITEAGNTFETLVPCIQSCSSCHDKHNQRAIIFIFRLLWSRMELFWIFRFHFLQIIWLPWGLNKHSFFKFQRTALLYLSTKAPNIINPFYQPHCTWCQEGAASSVLFLCICKLFNWIEFSVHIKHEHFNLKKAWPTVFSLKCLIFVLKATHSIICGRHFL